MRLTRRSIITVVTVAGATALAVAGPSAANAAPKPTPAAAANAPENVIVVLHDQLASTPANKHDMSARRSRATSTQDAVLSNLGGAAPKKVIVVPDRLVNVVA